MSGTAWARMDMEGMQHTYGAGVPRGYAMTQQGCGQASKIVESISVVIDSYRTNNDKAMPNSYFLVGLRRKNLGRGRELAHLACRWFSMTLRQGDWLRP